MAFEDVAELLVDLFADTDLVWTDVWAGVLLLSTKELRVMNERVSSFHAKHTYIPVFPIFGSLFGFKTCLL